MREGRGAGARMSQLPARQFANALIPLTLLQQDCGEQLSREAQIRKAAAERKAQIRKAAVEGGPN